METRTIALAIMLLILGAPRASAANTYLDVCSVSSIGGGGATDFIGIAFLLVSVLIALAYMYGKTMHNEHFEVWAKDEATNLFITALLFAGLAVFFSGSCTLAYEYTHDYIGAASPFQASYDYLDTLVQNNGQAVIKDLMARSINFQLGATAYLNLGFTPIFGHGAATDANKRALSSNQEFLVDMYLPLVASLSAQRQLLQVIEIVSASVLLPFAFFLRIIPQTREFGNMLIALFFGLYIILPTVYALSGAAFFSIGYSPGNVHDFKDLAYNNLEGSDSPLYKIGITLPQAVFLPNLALIIVTTCVMSLSKALHAIQA